MSAANNGAAFELMGEQVQPTLQRILNTTDTNVSATAFGALMANAPSVDGIASKQFTVQKSDNMSQGGSKFNAQPWHSLLTILFNKNTETATKSERTGFLQTVFFKAKQLKKEYQGSYLEIGINYTETELELLQGMGYEGTALTYILRVHFPRSTSTVGDSVLTLERFKSSVINEYISLCAVEGSAGALCDSCGYGEFVRYAKSIDKLMKDNPRTNGLSHAAWGKALKAIIDADANIGDKNRMYGVLAVAMKIYDRTVAQGTGTQKKIWDMAAIIGGGCSLKEWAPLFVITHPGVLHWSFIYAIMTDARASKMMKSTPTAAAAKYEPVYVVDFAKRIDGRGYEMPSFDTTWKALLPVFSSFVSYTGGLSGTNLDFVNTFIDQLDNNVAISRNNKDFFNI